MRTSNKKNIMYNLIFRLVFMLSPLITSPYLSRVLGAEMLGVHSSSYAFATYFLIFALLGVTDYGNKSIAQVRGDKEAMSNRFWQIYYLQILLSVVFLSAYLFTILFIVKDNFYIRLIMSLYVFSSFFEINWFAFGVGEFKLTSIRNVVIRVLIVICIFLFVKSSNDLWIYSMIIVLGNIVSLIVTIPILKKYISFRKPQIKEIFKHLKPNLIYFLPVIATTIYTQMDKVMLGFWSTNSEVGYYQNAENIVMLPLFITTAVITVLMPYSSNLYAQGKIEESKELLNKTLKYTSILNIAFAFGIASISPIFVPWYLGQGYERSAELIIILSPMIFFSGFSSIIRYQLLIPDSRDKSFVFSILFGAIINLILNCILIPYYSANGAAIATVVAYLSVLIIQLILTIRDIKYYKILLYIIPFILIGIAMFFFVSFIYKQINNVIISIILSVFAGALLYLFLSFIVLVIYKDEYVFKFFKKIKSRFMRIEK